MKPIYLKSGKAIIPGMTSAADILNGERVMPSLYEPNLSLGTVNHAALLEDSDLSTIAAGRMVRKTSERQSRWVIDAAVSTWQAFASNASPDRLGLFLGLGILDCEEDDQPLRFNGDLASYAVQMISDTNPLAGLTLLNSTAASHIAQLANITGRNAVFSPFADAGALALCEAYYHINDNSIDHALVAAGSQKITPWYFLTYRDMIKQWSEHAFPTESACSLIASKDNSETEACLLAVRRSFMPSSATAFPALDSLLSEVAGRGYALPSSIIISGTFKLQTHLEESLRNYFPHATQDYIDHHLGFCGPASAIHACHLAIAKHDQQDDKTTSLIIAVGHHGQLCYLVIGGNHHA